MYIIIDSAVLSFSQVTCIAVNTGRY